jgi:hypothetical protein
VARSRPVLNDEEIARRVAAAAAHEETQPERWFMLSFAEHRFLGCTIVRARGTLSAVRRAHAIGVNPGGSVKAYEIDHESPPPAALFEKLVTDKASVQAILDTWTDKS